VDIIGGLAELCDFLLSNLLFDHEKHFSFVKWLLLVCMRVETCSKIEMVIRS